MVGAPAAWLLPTTSKGLAQGVKALPAGTREGKNDWRRTGWGGPCPPIGEHRSFFKLYALDAVLPDLAAPTKAQLLAALKGHGVGRGTLMGTYQKKSQQGRLREAPCEAQPEPGSILVHPARSARRGRDREILDRWGDER